MPSCNRANSNVKTRLEVSPALASAVTTPSTAHIAPMLTSVKTQPPVLARMNYAKTRLVRFVVCVDLATGETL